MKQRENLFKKSEDNQSDKKQALEMSIPTPGHGPRHSRSMMDIYPIFSPRTSYKRIKQNDQKMIADMTLNFDKVTIQLLKQQFAVKDNELDLEQFIIIAKKHLKFWQVGAANRQIALIRYLTYLFNQIDINGNGDMQWEEFTNYVIEKATVLKNLKSKSDEVKHYIKSDLHIKAKIQTTIQKMEYIQEFDKVAYFEQGSNQICFFTLSTGQPSTKPLILDAKNLVVNISSVKKQKNGKVSIRKKDLILPTNVRILDMVYLSDKKYSTLVVSTSDGLVRGWKYHQGQFVKAMQPDNEDQLFEHNFGTQIYCLAWDNINEVLYCGQKNGSITAWSLKTDLQRPLDDRDQYGRYEQRDQNSEYPQQKINFMITSMLTMPKLQFMASGRMDGKLVLWDTINSKKKWVYKQHTLGILTLAFNQTMILLFSAGFDHKICIWNPYIQTLIHKIQGHLSPILSLKVIDNTYQLISMDSQGIVKIIDTKRFDIIYSFSVDTTNDMGEQPGSKKSTGSLINSLIVINNPLKLIFAGRTLAMYEYDKNYNPDYADQNTVICCRYVKSLLSFFTPAGNKIKVWSALNGDVQKIYMDVTPNEISTFDFDFLQKRIIIGDNKGNITLHNTVNGAKMKNLAKHNGQITHLISTHNDSNADIFISCAIDNQIKIAKQTQQSFEILRTIFIRKDICISSLKYIYQIKSIVVGTNIGSIVFYDAQTGKYSGNVVARQYEEVTSISNTQQSIILATTSLGSIIVIGLPPLPTRFEKIITIQHVDDQKQNSHAGIRCGCYSKQQNALFVADDKMYLTCYSFHNVAQKMKNADYSKQKTQSQRRQVIYKVFDIQNNPDGIIHKKWSIKAHTQPIKSIEYIQHQHLIITSSFDKRVKIWNSLTGEYIDSFRQNYIKKQPQPIAYLDLKKNILYANDKKKAVCNLTVQTNKTQFDPFYLNNILAVNPEFANLNSNQDWNLKVNFQLQALKEIKTFQELNNKLKLIQKQSLFPTQSSQKNSRFKEIKKDILTKRQKLREISQQNGATNNLKPIFFSDPNETQNDESQSNPSMITHQRGLKKVSTNYFKRSMMNCIQKFVQKNQNNQLINALKQHTKAENRKIRSDFIPIYKMINTTEYSSESVKSHRLYIEELAKKQTQSIINSRRSQKIILDKQGADKARKLCKLLINSDRKDQRTKNLMKSIQIRQRSTNPKSLTQRTIDRSVKSVEARLPLLQ